MEDWLSDPLMVFDSSKGSFTYRKPNIADTEVDKWQSFHFTTRLKLEGAVHFLRQLFGSVSLPEDKGLYLLAHRQMLWYADAFFFELCSAYDTLLQELNIIYSVGLGMGQVKWSAIEPKLPGKLVEIMEKEWDADWFKKVRWYRNRATHHLRTATARSTMGWGELPWHQKVTGVDILYFNEETNKFEPEDIKVCEHYLEKMIDLIHTVWSEMAEKFNQDD